MENETQNQHVSQTPLTSPSTPQPISPTPKSKLPLLLGGLLLLLLVGGGAYYLGTNNVQQKNNAVVPSPTSNLMAQSTSTPIPSPVSNNTLEEIHHFPIYSGATFLKKEETAPCPVEHSGYTDCGSIAYRWVVNEDTEKVQTWYGKDNLDKLGWELKGGAGSVGDFTTETWKEKTSDFRLTLQVLSNSTADTPHPDYKTTISILLPSNK